MRFAITKCHGSGNDFPLIDARGIAADWPAVARALADRTGPVGGDGLLLLKAGDDDHAFGFAMYNADGSEAETCLNGLRCVARAGFETLRISDARVRLKTSSVQVTLAPELAPGVVTIGERAGPVEDDPRRWLRIDRAPVLDESIPGLPSTRGFTAAAIPNPHLIAVVEEIDEAELVAVGQFAERAPPLLPERANVSFVELLGPDAIFVRTHERGVGLTNSCGSAMAASAWAVSRTGRIPWATELTVRNRGGLVRTTATPDGIVRLAGNATWDWTGSVDVVEGVARDIDVERRFPHEAAAWAAIAAPVGV